MIRVRAPSRLHFGLLALPSADDAPAAWEDRDGKLSLPARRFGGAGLMVERPGLAVTVEPAERWSADGPLAARALDYAKAVSARLQSTQPLRVVVEAAPPEHVGLGTGTQLGLALARAVAATAGRRPPDAIELAQLAGRGQRSALGTHGFVHGGFLVDGGKRSADGIAPLVAHVSFPDAWSILLIIPRDLCGDHGSRERTAFRTLAERPAELARTEALCRLVLLGMLPALVECDFDGFGEALYDFNRRVGQMFQPWQGGLYAHARIQHLVDVLRSSGQARGVGQSSWGPTVFAVMHREQANELGEWLVRRHEAAPDELVITAVSNRGALVEQFG
jgi:beta-ribofuranosylaminobenzene 5'-phosphate synthase